jgi:peptidyl-prolyl cis-trans isomerase SurA
MFHNILRKAALGLLFVLAFGSSITAQKPRTIIDKVVATVGDKIIMYSDIEELATYTESKSGTLPENARCYFVEQMLTQNLLLVQAERDSLVISDEELEGQLTSRVEQILDMMGRNEQQFVQVYGLRPSEMKDKMRDDMRNQMLTQRMQEQVISSVVITPAEVRKFFDLIPKDSLPYFNSEVEYAEIVIKPKVNAAEDLKARQQAEAIRNRIVIDGENFEDLAKKYSKDKGSAVKGGDLGVTKRGMFVPEFEAAAYKLKPGEISPIVKSQFGYHIIQMIERLGNSVHTRHILIKPTITMADEELALAEITRIRELIVSDSMRFVEAGKRFTEDEYSKNNGCRATNPNTGETFFELADLDPDVYFAFDTLEVGEVTAPIEKADMMGEKEYRIYTLQSRSLPHQANLKDDYARIHSAALEEKKARAITDWVKTKLSSTYIQIDDLYKSCENLKPWLKP